MRALLLACSATLFLMGCQTTGNWCSFAKKCPPTDCTVTESPSCHDSCQESSRDSCHDSFDEDSEDKLTPVPDQLTPQFPAAPVSIRNPFSGLRRTTAGSSHSVRRVLGLKQTSFTVTLPRLITVPAEVVGQSSPQSDSAKNGAPGRGLTVDARSADKASATRKAATPSERGSVRVVAGSQDDLARQRDTREASVETISEGMRRQTSQSPYAANTANGQFVIPSYNQYAQSDVRGHTATEAPSTWNNWSYTQGGSNWTAPVASSPCQSSARSDSTVENDSGIEMWPFRPSPSRYSSPW